MRSYLTNYFINSKCVCGGGDSVGVFVCEREGKMGVGVDKVNSNFTVSSLAFLT